jgi:hypothetical protein
MPDGLKPTSDDAKPGVETPVPLTYYARVAAAEARRFRRAFTRENIIDFVKAMAWVVPLTLLIWVYAERETVETEDNFAVPIEVKSTDPNRVVSLVQPPDKNLICVLEGPKSRLDQLRLALPKSPLMIPIDDSTPIGPNNAIQTLLNIQNDPRFVTAGVSVLKTDPPTLIVSVDRLVSREVDVQAPASITNLESAKFTPRTVVLSGPSSTMDRLAKDGHLFVTADLTGLPVLNDPGQHTVPSVGLLSPDNDLTMSVTTVAANLTVKQADVTQDIPNVPVWVAAPRTVLSRYTITDYPELLAKITVVGPANKIADLTGPNPSVKLVAALPIDTSDVVNPAGGPKSKPLIIMYLPDGVHLSGDPPEASFKVRDNGG